MLRIDDIGCLGFEMRLVDTMWLSNRCLASRFINGGMASSTR